jgi:hypothetical protein
MNPGITYEKRKQNYSSLTDDQANVGVRKWRRTAKDREK